jgi:ATP-dependent Zn protease
VIVAVRLEMGNGGDEELDLQARQLREELLLLDLDAVALGRDVSEPAGAKGDPVAIGTLIMTLGNSAVLVAACRVIRAWIGRGQARRATIKYGENRTLEITGATTEQQQELISAFLAAIKRDTESAHEELSD